MRILLISPAIFDSRGNLIKQNRIWLPGLTLPYIAALIPNQHEIAIIDETSEDVPYDQKWDLVLISSIGAGVVRASEIAAVFQSRHIPVIIGGIAASLTGVEEFGKYFDSFVEGEAETVIDEILKDFEQGELKKYYKGEIADLSKSPIPRYELMNRSKIGFWMPVQSSRGCKHKCPFCSVAAFNNGNLRKFPIEYIVECVRKVKKLGYSNITLIDDSIASDLNHLKELCEALIPLKVYWMSQCTINIAEHSEILSLMAKSGCTMLSIGIESVNGESIDSINKNFNKIDKYTEYFRIIRSYGIDISTEMMIGLDGDTDEIYDDFYEFAINNKITLPRFYILTPVPGTKLYAELKSENRIFNNDIAKYTGSKLVFYPKKLTHETLEDSYWKMYEKVYTFKNIMRRYILSRPKRSFFSNIFVLAANFHYKKHIKQRIPPGIV
jgi:radical SAM superfamily enzyme YgiQ (UPF0313 family)